MKVRGSEVCVESFFLQPHRVVSGVVGLFSRPHGRIAEVMSFGMFGASVLAGSAQRFGFPALGLNSTPSKPPEP